MALCRLLRPLGRAVLLASPQAAQHGGSECAVHGGLVAALAFGLALEPVDHVFIDAEGQQPLRGAVEAASDGVGPVQHLGGVRVGRVDLSSGIAAAARNRSIMSSVARWLSWCTLAAHLRSWRMSSIVYNQAIRCTTKTCLSSNLCQQSFVR